MVQDRPCRCQSARRGVTLVELITVIVVLAIMAGVALPVFFDHADEARTSADKGGIAGIKTAMIVTFGDNRMHNRPAANWIDDVTDIPNILVNDMLPEGITINGAKLEDSRGNTYTLTAETASEPARLTLDP
jgi:prepilin-type N-terminal cleavage/methylation domain-containing protein